MLKFGNKEFRNIQEQVEKNAKDIEELKEQGVPGGSGESGLPTDKPTDDGQILIGNTDGSVEWSTETLREFQHELVSGSNIKTINGESILGSGNIEISGGGTVSVDNVVEFDTLSTSAYSPTSVDEATLTKLQDPNTIIKFKDRIFYYDKIEVLSTTTTITYITQTSLVYDKINGEATVANTTIKVRSVSTSDITPLGVWWEATTATDIPTSLGTNFTDDGDYIWVANKNGTTKKNGWQKYTPGSGGSVDLNDYYTKEESENQFAAKTTFNTTVMGINAVLDEIPTTYATNTGVANLEATVMGEISSLETRVEALEDGGGGTGGSGSISEYPTQDFKIDSTGTYYKINVDGSTEALAPDLVDLGSYSTGLNYENIYTFYRDQILRCTYTGGRGRIALEDGWNAWGTGGSNGNKLWIACMNSGLDVGNFSNPKPKAIIVEYVAGVLTFELILNDGIRAILVINENSGGYSSDGFQQIAYGGGGGITTQDPVSADGQILIGNVDGTYNWTTETFYEITNRITDLESVVSNIVYYEGETE